MEAKLRNLRKRVDKLDSKILRLLSKRMKVAKQIDGVKTEMGFGRTDRIRESEMKKMRSELAKIYKLDRKFTEEVFDLIVKESKRLQNHT